MRVIHTIPLPGHGFNETIIMTAMNRESTVHKNRVQMIYFAIGMLRRIVSEQVIACVSMSVILPFYFG